MTKPCWKWNRNKAFERNVLQGLFNCSMQNCHLYQLYIGYPNSTMKDPLTENITGKCCFKPVYIWYRSPRWFNGKESVCQGHGFNPWIRNWTTIPWIEFPTIPHSRKWQPTPVFLYSCLVNSMNRGAWQATIHGVAKSQTWPSTAQFSSQGGETTCIMQIQKKKKKLFRATTSQNMNKSN